MSERSVYLDERKDLTEKVSAWGIGPGGAPDHYKLTVCAANGEPRELELHFQHGPVAEAGVNGFTNEQVLAVVLDRLQQFQKGPFACVENQTALHATEAALGALRARTDRRIAAGVEGTHAQDPLRQEVLTPMVTDEQLAVAEALAPFLKRGMLYPPEGWTTGKDADGLDVCWPPGFSAAAAASVFLLLGWVVNRQRFARIVLQPNEYEGEQWTRRLQQIVVEESPDYFAHIESTAQPGTYKTPYT